MQSSENGAMPLAESPPGAITRIDGREYAYFVGTGYLGLQGHPEVIRAACEAAQHYGIGSANSRTAFGTTPPVLEVEGRAAAMFGLDDAFYFASGWMGNNILTQLGLPESGHVFLDECSHYSIIEAARLTGWPNTTFRHRDSDDLRAKLREHVKPGQNVLVLSDGVFAATGRIAPVAEYHAILQDYPESALYIDDAHGIAVLGENGRGTLEHAGLWHHGPNVVGEGTVPIFVPAKMGLSPSPSHLIFCGTLSKAVGGFGGIIPGCREFIRRIKLRSPYYGGASAPPAPVAAATAKALELLAADPSMRTRLWSNARLLKDGLRGLGFDVDESPVPIACLVLGDAENMQRIQRELMQRGIAVAYMAAYSGLGPKGALRIAVFATHTPAMIGRLLEELGRIV
jgi:7-keto-8-aminopelargonate synthetase-like enzyme